MTIQSPGMICVDRFARDLGQRAGDEAVRIIGLPLGYVPQRCLEHLAVAAHQHGQCLFVYPHAGEGQVTDARAALSTVARTLGLADALAERSEDLVLGQVDDFRQPKNVGLILRPGMDAPTFDAIVEVCLELAELTKDLRGRLGFVLLTPDQPALDGLAQLVHWRPLTPQPDFLSFEDLFTGSGITASRLEQHGFDIYLSLRSYWEAAGAPDFLARLQPAHDMAAFWVANDAADQRIGQKFDELIALDARDAARLVQVFEQVMATRADRAVFSTGLLQPSCDDDLKRLVACGLGWHPPGSYHLRVAPLAARALGDAEGFTTRWELSPGDVQRFRVVSRMNPLIAAWVMSLSGLIEMEMLNFCKQIPALQDTLVQIGLHAELAEHRERSLAELPDGYHTELVDHASFGHLQQLIGLSGARERFPLSARRMDQIRRIRNLAAHRHPILWPHVRVLIQALATLFAREKRFRPRAVR